MKRREIQKEIKWYKWQQRVEHVCLHHWQVALHRSAQTDGQRGGRGERKQQSERRRALVARWTATAIYWLSEGLMSSELKHLHLKLTENIQNQV